MPNPEVLLRRLRALESYLAVLRSIQRYSREEFLADPEHYGAAERFLQLALECLNDMGGHVVADLHLGAADTYAEVVERLATAGYIDAELERTWLRMVGFRNVLVHDYLTIDRDIVFDVLQRRLDDFVALQRMFAGML
jgi:uncharacterized protein YutE (UPF0331/DUF86 family)